MIAELSLNIQDDLCLMESQNEQRLIAIKVFNATLAKQCHNSGNLFADVYNLTAGADGYNNNDWMIDSKHLKPEALSELINNIQC